MQRLDRNSWIMLVGSIAVAVALVTLIPYYGLVGGHQEHGVTAAGPLSASSHRYVILPDGVDMVMTAESDTDTATITAIQTHMQDEAARYRAGDYGDDMAMVSADLIAALRDHQADITVTVVAAGATSTIQFRSQDSATVAWLKTWADQMSAHNTDHSMHP
jgi:hypothetical protein